MSRSLVGLGKKMTQSFVRKFLHPKLLQKWFIKAVNGSGLIETRPYMLMQFIESNKTKFKKQSLFPSVKVSSALL